MYPKVSRTQIPIIESSGDEHYFTKEMQIVWQENVSKKIIILEEKMSRAFERMNELDERIIQIPTHINGSSLIEHKILPFMDHIDQEIQHLKKQQLTEKISDHLKRKLEKTMTEMNDKMNKEIEKVYELVRQNINSQKDLIEEWKNTKRTIKHNLKDKRQGLDLEQQVRKQLGQIINSNNQYLTAEVSDRLSQRLAESPEQVQRVKKEAMSRSSEKFYGNWQGTQETAQKSYRDKENSHPFSLISWDKPSRSVCYSQSIGNNARMRSHRSSLTGNY